MQTTFSSNYNIMNSCGSLDKSRKKNYIITTGRIFEASPTLH